MQNIKEHHGGNITGFHLEYYKAVHRKLIIYYGVFTRLVDNCGVWGTASHCMSADGEIDPSNTLVQPMSLAGMSLMDVVADFRNAIQDISW